jgi:hypothetical protein
MLYFWALLSINLGFGVQFKTLGYACWTQCKFFYTYVASGDSWIAFRGLQDATNQFDEQMVIGDAGLEKVYKTMM